MFTVKSSFGEMGKMIDDRTLIGRSIRMKINGEWVTIGRIVEVISEENQWIGEIQDEYKDKLLSEYPYMSLEFKTEVKPYEQTTEKESL